MQGSAGALEARIAAVRHFNRFYTRQIGVLQDGLLQTSFSLTEARVLHELAYRDKLTAKEIGEALEIDQGYLSRILRSFSERGLITRAPSPADRRNSLLSLTTKGRLAFGKIDERSEREVGALLGRLDPKDQTQVIEAMTTIEKVLQGNSGKRTYTLRSHRAGDMGWVVAKHGLLYPAEYGWDSRIEALTAEIVANFLKNFDPAREHCWIAEMDGEPVGSVFLVREPGMEDVARLRLLIVDPAARGLGIGKHLVDECIRFARQGGYRKITLWTHAVLVAARAIYQQAGFKLTEEWVHEDFGKPEVSETWEILL
jgi:DNA-binding MarR family transcriptional regulator/GNAT superfamily N-acetyltransferase